MSCNVDHNKETQEPASSHAPEGSDCRQDGGGDPPIGHGNDAEQEVRTPLQDVSSTSSTTEAGSQAKGKKRAVEVQDSMTSTNSVPGPINSGKKARTRLNMEQKAEVLQLLNNGKKHAEIAQRYACCERTVSMIAKKKGQLELKIKSPGFNGKAKSEKSPGFPELDIKVMKMVEDARKIGVPVTRQVISNFGRAVKSQMLSSNEISEVQKKRLHAFCASDKWTRNFARRQGIVSKAMHGEAGGVNREAAKGGVEAIREAASHHALDNIFHVGETWLFYKVLPRRTYVASGEGRKSVRGVKDMEDEDRVSVYLCANASGSLKVPVSIVGKSENPCCFEKRSPPVKYFAQKTCADSRIFQRWWTEVFLPFIEENTSGEVLLIMDGGKSDGDLNDPSGRVQVVYLPPKRTSVHQPMDLDVAAAIKLRYRRRLLDYRAEKVIEAAALRDEAQRKKMKAGKGGLEQGSDPDMHDVGILLRDAWDDIDRVTIARCWELAEMLPPNYQQVVRELRRKGDTSASGEEGDNCGCSGEVETQLRDSIIKVSLSLRIAGEETCVAFKDMRDMLDNLGIECGTIASDGAVKAVVEWLNLENHKDVSEAIKRDGQEITVQDIESNMGYCTGDELGNDGEGPKAKDKAPQELSLLLDALEAHPMVIASPQAQQCVRQLRELFADHFDGQDTQSGDTETTETID